jgi:hypothetical protein
VNIEGAVQSQYLAALRMLKDAIVKCPPALWNAPRGRDKTWFKAYHAVYWTHKYLQATAQDFVAWKARGRPNDWKGHGKPNGGVPLSKQELLEYLAFVEQQVAERVPATDFGGPSGFYGSRLDKLEWAIVNIRHIQQHTGELYERLGSRRDIQLRWAEHVHRKKP